MNTLALLLLASSGVVLLALALYAIGVIVPKIQAFLVRHLVLPVVSTLGHLNGLFCTKCAHECRSIFCITDNHFKTKDGCQECGFWREAYGDKSPETVEERVKFIFGRRMWVAYQEMTELGNNEQWHKVMNEVSRYMGHPVLVSVKTDQCCPETPHSKKMGGCDCCQSSQKPSCTRTISSAATPETTQRAKSESGGNQNDANAA